MPEVLWKAYIDFEISEGESDNVRSLYNRLLERTNHVKVWISYAQFESSDIGGGLEASRKIFQQGYGILFAFCNFSSYDSLKSEGLKEERVVLLEAWKVVEQEAITKGEAGDVDFVLRKFPRKIKMRRMVTEGGKEGDEGLEWEEYYDYHFPDDEKKIGQFFSFLFCHQFLTLSLAGIKILENALKWKQMMANANTSTTTSNQESELGKRKERDENEVVVEGI